MQLDIHGDGDERLEITEGKVHVGTGPEGPGDADGLWGAEADARGLSDVPFGCDEPALGIAVDRVEERGIVGSLFQRDEPEPVGLSVRIGALELLEAASEEDVGIPSVACSPEVVEAAVPHHVLPGYVLLQLELQAAVYAARVSFEGTVHSGLRVGKLDRAVDNFAGLWAATRSVRVEPRFSSRQPDAAIR